MWLIAIAFKVYLGRRSQVKREGNDHLTVKGKHAEDSLHLNEASIEPFIAVKLRVVYFQQVSAQKLVVGAMLQGLSNRAHSRQRTFRRLCGLPCNKPETRCG